MCLDTLDKSDRNVTNAEVQQDLAAHHAPLPLLLPLALVGQHLDLPAAQQPGKETGPLREREPASGACGLCVRNVWEKHIQRATLTCTRTDGEHREIVLVGIVPPLWLE